MFPRADCWILPGGTAYQTDVGMCGDYDSVIGMKKETAVQRFVRKVPGERLAPAEGEGTLCAAVVETDDRTGLADLGPADQAGRPPAADGVKLLHLVLHNQPSYLLEVV